MRNDFLTGVVAYKGVIAYENLGMRHTVDHKSLEEVLV